jgi:sugar lactone lactonase YvrE
MPKVVTCFLYNQNIKFFKEWKFFLEEGHPRIARENPRLGLPSLNGIDCANPLPEALIGASLQQLHQSPRKSAWLRKNVCGILKERRGAPPSQHEKSPCKGAAARGSWRRNGAATQEPEMISPRRFFFVTRCIPQWVWLGLLLVTAALAGCSSGDDSVPPDVISLPTGFRPEGIAISDGNLFVGSIPTGRIFKASLANGEGALLVEERAGRNAIGLKVDARGRIFVAGGQTGKGFVYDAATGADIAEYNLTAISPTFVNDVILTPDAAWFTDSRNQILYRVAIPAQGPLGGQEAVSALPLTGDLALSFDPAVNNLNGIAFSGGKLVAVQSNTGFLFTVDPATGITRRIDLGEETVPNGDGLLLEGQTLFVVQNRLNLLAVVDLAPDLGSGTVRTRIADPSFDVPTTVAASDGSLYLVNARFGVADPDAAEYTVVRIDKPPVH